MRGYADRLWHIPFPFLLTGFGREKENYTLLYI